MRNHRWIQRKGGEAQAEEVVQPRLKTALERTTKHEPRGSSQVGSSCQVGCAAMLLMLRNMGIAVIEAKVLLSDRMSGSQ